MKKDEKEIVEQWRLIANDDWLSANDLFKSKIYRNACFFCQQTVEKYLKSLLAANNITFKKNHNLEELTDLLIRNNIAIDLEINGLRKLNAFYIESRYPDAYFEIYSLGNAKEALEIAKEMIEEIRRHLTAIGF